MRSPPCNYENMIKIWLNSSTVQGIYTKGLDYKAIFKDVISASPDWAPLNHV